MTPSDPLTTQQRVRQMVRLRRRRRRRRVAKAVSLMLVVLVVLGGAAFGIDRGVVWGERLWDEHHRTSAAPPPQPPTTTTSTTTTIPGPPRCTQSQLDAYLFDWQENQDTLYEVVELNNISSAPCTLYGYPTLAAGGPGGGLLPAPVQDDPSLGAALGGTTTTPPSSYPTFPVSTTTTASRPAAGAPGSATTVPFATGSPLVPVPLDSGQRAWFEFTYPVTCSIVLVPGEASTGASGECYKGTSFGFTVPLSDTAFSIPQPLDFTFGTAGFTVGPFRAGPPPPSPPGG